MDLITMTEGRFDAFFDKDRENSLIRGSYTYLDRFARTGEAAFTKFGIAIEGREGVKFGMCTMHDPRSEANEEPPWYILAFIRLTCEELGWDDLLPVMLQLTLKNRKLLDMCIDIPEGDQHWAAKGCRTMNDLPDSLVDHLRQMSKPLVCMFAWIQKKALKTRSKVERVRRQAEEKTPRKNSTSRPSAPRVIRLTGDTTYSVVADTGLPRQFTRRCEAWEVRGHYRHYKSGKVVFVRPHIRGAGAVKDKQYSV